MAKIVVSKIIHAGSTPPPAGGKRILVVFRSFFGKMLNEARAPSTKFLKMQYTLRQKHVAPFIVIYLIRKAIYPAFSFKPKKIGSRVNYVPYLRNDLVIQRAIGDMLAVSAKSNARSFLKFLLVYRHYMTRVLSSRTFIRAARVTSHTHVQKRFKNKKFRYESRRL